MDLELNGKVAIVTDGSRGIGKAIARQLAREGADVAIVARQLEALQATANEIASETGRRIVPVVADTGSDASVAAMVRTVIETFGHVDILINCAAQPGGQSTPPKLAEIDDKVFWDDVNVKVLGYLRTCREVAPHLVARGWGRIINISGLAARSTGSTITSIRNVAVVALTKNLADELGPHGINVTVVHPGTTRTEKTAGVVARQAEARGISVEEVERGMASANSIRRILDASDVANVVAFLASPKSVAINGDVIAAGGGVGRGIFY